MVNSTFLVFIVMVLILKGIFSEHNYIGQSKTFHLQNVPDNLKICSPQNQPILTKNGDSCQSTLSRIGIQECSDSALVFILSDLRLNDTGIYHICQQTSWAVSLHVQGYPVEVIATPQSPAVRDGDNVILTCKHRVPANIWRDVTVQWTVQNAQVQDVYWNPSTDSINVDVSLTRDCDMYSCQLYRHGALISHSNKPPFKINKINESGEMPKHVSYTGSSITFIIPESAFEDRKPRQFFHSSGYCLYNISLKDGFVNKCPDLPFINNRRVYISMKLDHAVYITIEDLSPFDSGKYRLDDGSQWQECLLVWGYESSIKATPSLPTYGGELTLTCDHTANTQVTEYRWYRINDTVEVLNATGKRFTVGSNLTEREQGSIYQCRPVFQFIGFSPSPQYTVNMFIPPKITSFTIDGRADSITVDEGDSISFDCQDVASVPVTTRFYVTHDPNKLATPTVELIKPINATCNSDGVWMCHVFYEYGDGDKERVLEDKKNITLVVNKCKAKIQTNDTSVKVPVKYGESTEAVIPFTGTHPTVEINGIPILSRTASGLPPVNVTLEGKFAKIRVNMADAEVFGANITLTLSNEFGNDSKVIIIEPVGEPQPPSNLTVSDIGGDFVTLQWHPGFTSGNQSFTIEHKNSSSDWSVLDTQRSDGDREQTYPHTSMFDPRTLYDYRVMGVNDEGNSSYSNVLSVFVGNETIVWNVTIPGPSNQPQANNDDVLIICLTVGVISTLIFAFVMVLFCTQRRKDKDERLLVVDNLHRSSSARSSNVRSPNAISPNVSSAEGNRESGVSGSLTPQIGSANTTFTQARDSEPVTGSSQTQYVQNTEIQNTNVNLPRLSSDYRSPESPARRVRFPSAN